MENGCKGTKINANSFHIYYFFPKLFEEKNRKNETSAMLKHDGRASLYSFFH